MYRLSLTTALSIAPLRSLVPFRLLRCQIFHSLGCFIQVITILPFSTISVSFLRQVLFHIVGVSTTSPVQRCYFSLRFFHFPLVQTMTCSVIPDGPASAPSTAFHNPATLKCDKRSAIMVLTQQSLLLPYVFDHFILSAFVISFFRLDSAAVTAPP
jgi:hypothetical protein